MTNISVNSSSPYLNVNQSQNFSYGYNYGQSMALPNVRYNSSNNTLEALSEDGNWKIIPGSYITIGLSPYAEELLSYVSRIRDEDLKISDMAKSNNAVRIAVENVEIAKKQLKTTIILAETETTR